MTTRTCAHAFRGLPQPRLAQGLHRGHALGVWCGLTPLRRWCCIMSEDIPPYGDRSDGDVFQDAKHTRFQFIDEHNTNQPRCVLTLLPDTPGDLDPPALHLESRTVQQVIERLQQFLDYR